MMNEAKMQADEIRTALSSALDHLDALIDAIESNIGPLFRSDLILGPAKVDLDRTLQLIEISKNIIDNAKTADKKWEQVFQAL